MGNPRGSATTLAALVETYALTPFRLAEAAASGHAASSSLRSCLGAGQLVRLRPGVAATRPALEALADDPRAYQLLQVRAAHLHLPRPGWTSLDTAGLAHDLPRRLAAGLPRVVHIDVPGLPDKQLAPYPTPADLPWFVPVHLHGTSLAEGERARVDDVPTTSLARTAVELARGAPLPVALVPMDVALRRLTLLAAPRGVDARAYLAAYPAAIAAGRAELSAVVARMRGWPGVVAAREAVAYADPRAESPLESCSRGHVIVAELPLPQVGAAVVGDDGRTYYADLLWRRHCVIGECDGWGKYALDGQDPMVRLRAEKQREDALRRAGWVVVRWTSDELLRTPELVVSRISQALSVATSLPPVRGWAPKWASTSLLGE